MKTTKGAEQRDVYRNRVLKIAHEAGARCLHEYTETDLTRVHVMLFWANHRQVLVRFDDESCVHYVQGGSKWEDLERDFAAEAA